MNRTRTFLGISLVTLSVLMLELAVTRIFSATMYYHYAFMAISVALFGSGASGVFIYLLRPRISEAPLWMSASAALFGLSTVMALYVILTSPISLSADPENYYRLAQIYVATSLPFFFAGCAVTVAITVFAKEISRLYLYDLAGAAAGCLLLIPVLNRIGGINTVLLVASLAGAAAVVLGASRNRAFSAILLTVAACLAALLIYNCVTNRIDIRQAKGYRESDLLFSKWNSFSRVTVEGDLEGPTLQIKIDADAGTGISRDAGYVSRHDIQRSRIDALAYHLQQNANVLIIGPGGGNDVMTARVFGMSNITAVEVNPIIARDVMSSEPFMSYSGSIFQQPGVRLVVDEGRSFIRRSDERYDIIQATMVDTWAATAAGAFALTENNLYTVEAFKDYVEHLTGDGVLTMTRWYFDPPDQLLRLVSLTRAMMAELNIDNPDRHIMIVCDRNWNAMRVPATVIFKKSRFTDEEVRTVESVAAANEFKVFYTPLTRPDNVFTEMIEAADPATVWSSFETNVEPTRDNNPFFFNSIRLSNLTRALSGAGEWQKTNLGTFVLFELLVISAVLVLAFILGPLVLARSRILATGTERKLSYLLYFACLGAGFIILEIAMIQKFILFLGHPVYSLAVVLFSLLTFSAIGSKLSGRSRESDLMRSLRRILVTLALVVAVYIVIVSPLFYGLVHLDHPLRIVISVALIAPLAILMGMPMPIGIRILASNAPDLVPWAWGVNGAASVMGSVGALAIAILTGFNQALAVGAALYVVALFLIARPKWKMSKRAVEPAIEEPATVG